MTSPRDNDNDLNALLRAWALKRAISADETRDLAARIHQRLVEDRNAPSRSRAVTLLRQEALWLATGRNSVLGFGGFRKDSPRLGVGSFTWTVPLIVRMGYAALGALAMLMLCLAALWMGNTPKSVTQPAASGLLAAITPVEQQTGSRLFHEMERLFSDELRWIAESNGDVGLGVESSPGTLARTAPVLVKVSVLSRRSSEEPWQTFWKAGVLLRSEERTQIVMNGKTENGLTLWVYPLADGKIAVDTALDLKAPVRVASHLDSVLEQNVPAEIVRVRDAEAEYRVFQTVSVLNSG